MKKLFEKLRELRQNGEDAVLATVIADSGSVPRGSGARMLCGREGLIAGTIGGGAVEYRAVQLASEVLRERQSYSRAFQLRRNEVEDLGMICGGDVRVFFQFIAAADSSVDVILDRWILALSGNVNSYLVLDITDETGWGMELYIEGEDDIAPEMRVTNAGQLELEGRRYFIEPLTRRGKVIIFGGGHIARELVPLLARLDFRCVVFEDREEFAARELFPSAFDIVLGDLGDIKGKITIDKEDYIVILTRGHSHDYEVEYQVLQSAFRYVGVIGSRRKRESIRERLRLAGIPEEQLNRVHAPIGTAIKASTPAEIAVSIAGELILVRAESV